LWEQGELMMGCRVQLGFDVLNALTLQDNTLFLEDLKVSFVVFWSSSYRLVLN
jgi:hypothetical protein